MADVVTELLARATGFQPGRKLHVDAVKVSEGPQSFPVQLTPRGRKLVEGVLSADASVVAAVERVLAGQSDPEMPALLSPNAAAAVLAVSRPTVVKWASEGLLTDVAKGKHHQFLRHEVERLRDSRLEQARANRERAEAERAAVTAAGVDIDVPPTPQEMAAAGAALRRGDQAGASAVLVRARRADARRSAQATAAGE